MSLRRRHATDEPTTVDRLALSRAQHFQSRDQRAKSISDDDDEVNSISDWSDSDRECCPLSDIECLSNSAESMDNLDRISLVKQISLFDPVQNPTTTLTISGPMTDESTTSTRISFTNELEKPKQQYMKKTQTSAALLRKQTQAAPPLLPARRIQSKISAARRPSIRSTTTSQSSFSSRIPQQQQRPSRLSPTRLQIRRETTSTSTSFQTHLSKDSRLSPNSSIHSHEKSLLDEPPNNRRNYSPNLSQSSVPRVYEVKKAFVDETDYGRVTDTNVRRLSPPRERQKWGTIVHPPFPLGYQHINPDQLTHIVERLASPVRCRDRHPTIQSPSKRYLSVEETEALVNRLNKVKTIRSPDQYWPTQRASRSVKPLNNTTNFKTVGISA